MAGEQCADERIQDIEEAFKVDVVIRGIDVTLEQLKDRFTDEDIAFLREIHLFSHVGLMSIETASPNDIENICKFCDLDADLIVDERNAFAPVYQSMASLVNISDLQLEETAEENADCEDDSFVKPLRALQQLSLFPNLLCRLKILVSVPVTSCSAERIMSRVKVIENRLRSTMDDVWFSALTILASEKDVANKIPTNDIIDTFALCSSKLMKLLGGSGNAA